MGPYQRTPFSKLLELLYTQVFSGSVKRGSDRWGFLRFIGLELDLLMKQLKPGWFNFIGLEVFSTNMINMMMIFWGNMLEGIFSGYE